MEGNKEKNPMNYVIPVGMLLAIMTAVDFENGGGDDNLVCIVYCGLTNPHNPEGYAVCMSNCVR